MKIKNIDIEKNFGEYSYYCCCIPEADSELTITFEGSFPEIYQVYKDLDTRKNVNLDCSYSGVKINKSANYLDLSKVKVIYQDNVTVLKANGKVYIAKPEKGDKFDREKGLLICLVKAFGLTTTDVLNILNMAEVKKSKAKANIIKQDKTNKNKK